MITTKKGDRGMTDYFGKRVAKDSDVVEMLGNLDELQAVLMVMGIKSLTEELGEIMAREPMGQKIKNLEKEIDKLWKELKPKSQFVIFEKEKAVKINWARTVARRAERRAVSAKSNKDVIIYLNRLSDYLYLLALKEEKK